MANPAAEMLRQALMLVALAGLAACEQPPATSLSPGERQVRQAVAAGLPLVVEFGASTCSSCKDMKIVLDRVASRTEGKAKVLIIDIGKDWAAGNAFGIQYMPTQVLFDAQGREIGRHIGKLTGAEVMQALGQDGGT